MSSTSGEPIGPASGTAVTGPPADSEEAILQRAGYRPELRRSLKFFSMFAIAFSIISITTGIFLNYAFGLAYWGPASIWTWPIVGVGNLMIAFVVAELGTRIPLAGYAYQWSARLVNPTYGWFVGFAPADHPKIVVAVLLEFGLHGSRAAHIASAIIGHFLKVGPIKAVMDEG